MRLRSPLLAVLGLLAVGAVGLQLLTERLTLGQAALRVVVAVAVLAVVDRVGVPLARAMVGPGKPPPAGRVDDASVPPA